MGIFDFASIRRSVSTLETKLKEMQDELADLYRQREAVLSTAASKDDLKALLRDWVVQQGDKYQTSLHGTLARFTRNPRNVTPHELASVMSIAGAAQPFGDVIRPQDVDQALCGLFGPMVSAALLDQVDKMEWPANSMTGVQRTAAADKLTDRIDTLEKDTKELINAAEEAGINWNRQ
ncbi:MAG: hypothetical protein ACXW24_16100 [Telluria sp.]